MIVLSARAFRTLILLLFYKCLTAVLSLRIGWGEKTNPSSSSVKTRRNPLAPKGGIRAPAPVRPVRRSSGTVRTATWAQCPAVDTGWPRSSSRTAPKCRRRKDTTPSPCSAWPTAGPASAAVAGAAQPAKSRPGSATTEISGNCFRSARTRCNRPWSWTRRPPQSTDVL